MNNIPSALSLLRQTSGLMLQIGNEAVVAAKSDGLLTLTGPAIPLDKVSANGRFYIPESVHSCVAELQPRIAAKALLGETDHPITTDLNRMAYVQLTNVSHRIDALWFDTAKNCYMITVTILNTPSGNILKGIWDAGSPLYVSLRSLLDPARQTSRRGGGNNVWMTALITIDFVSRPGFADAELTAVSTATESMKAICESLSIFNTKTITDMTKTGKPEMYAVIANEATIEAIAVFKVSASQFFANLVSAYGNLISLDDITNYCANNYGADSTMNATISDAGVVTLSATNMDLHASVQLETSEDKFVVSPELAEQLKYSSESGEIAANEDYQVIKHSETPEEFISLVDKFIADLTGSLGDAFESAELARYCQNYDERGFVQINNDKIHVYSLEGQHVAYIPVAETADGMSKLSDDITYYENIDNPDFTDLSDMDHENALDTGNEGFYEIVSNENFEVPANGSTGRAATAMADTNIEPYTVLTDNNSNSGIPTELYEVLEPVQQTASVSKVALEFANAYRGIAQLPDSKYAGNYAIEHMPAAYKHIWNSMSDNAKTLVSKRGETIGNESDNLKFWANLDVIAIERALLNTDTILTAGLENFILDKAPVDAKLAFLRGQIR
jgi:hypothetical protein